LILACLIYYPITITLSDRCDFAELIKVYVNDPGEYLLKVEGRPQPLRLWQVSRIALDDLFFGF